MTIGLLTANKMTELMKGERNVGGKYNEAANTIYLAQAGSADAVTFAHELAHAFSARRNSFGQQKVNLFPGQAPLNGNDWGYGALFGEYDYRARTWAPDGGGWTAYASGKYDTYIKLVFLRARYYSPETGGFLSKDMWQGDYTRPQSLNAWLYVEGDPINRVDPSGQIAEGQEAHDADSWRNVLHSQLGIEIAADYGYQQSTVGKMWSPGAWRSVRELQDVYDAASFASAAMGNNDKLKSAMKGSLTISRWSGAASRSFSPPVLQSILGDVVLTDFVFNLPHDEEVYDIIHEFGHVWDHKEDQRLSRDMESALGTSYCYKAIGMFSQCVCRFDITAGKEIPPGVGRPGGPYAGNSREEDWAEAFANYVDSRLLPRPTLEWAWTFEETVCPRSDSFYPVNIA